MSGTLYTFPHPVRTPDSTISGSGTATLYLQSPGTPGSPNSWRVTRAVLRFDSLLPAPWASLGIGRIVGGGTTGSVSSGSDPTFTVAGGGADIWGTSDEFEFAYAWPAGPEIVARVDAEQNTNPFAKAGVMFRSSFDVDAAHVLVDVEPDGSVELLTRSTAGGATSYIGGTTVGFPAWLKLSETSSSTTAYVSTDGQTWRAVGSVPFAPRFGGLAVTSHDSSVLNQALFSHVHVAPDPNGQPPFGWQQTDVGAVTLPGSATIAGTQATVSGDGADIWGTADAFSYLYQSLPRRIHRRSSCDADTNTIGGPLVVRLRPRRLALNRSELVPVPQFSMGS
jgi:hypothetical protein